MNLRDYLVRNEVFEEKGEIEELIAELVRMGYKLSSNSTYGEVIGVLKGAVGYKWRAADLTPVDSSLHTNKGVVG